MTPAERASAVAFSYKNCELSGIVPSDVMVEAANGYQRGTLKLSNFAATPERYKPHSNAQHEEHQPSECNGSNENSLLGHTEIGIGDDAHPTNQRKRIGKRNETRLRGDRIFARSVRLIDYGWRAVGGLDELMTIHRGLFVGAMPGAGRFRTDNDAIVDANLATDQSSPTDEPRNQQHQPSSPYFPAALIETGAANIFSQLAEQDYFSRLDRAGFIHALASIYDELNALRPFAYGNGMVLRIYISELTHAVGWDLNWGTVTFDSYHDATRKALVEHDISGLERMFASIIRLANPTRIFLISGWDQGPAH